MLLLIALPGTHMLMGAAVDFPLLFSVVLLAAVPVNSPRRRIFSLSVALCAAAIGGTAAAGILDRPVNEDPGLVRSGNRWRARNRADRQHLMVVGAGTAERTEHATRPSRPISRTIYPSTRS